MELNDRLVKAKRAAGFNTADMAAWFDDVGQSTMRTWLSGVTPGDHRHDQIESNLALLESAIKQGDGLPVPLHITQFTRKEYIRKVKNDIAQKLSKPRTARGGYKVLGGDTLGE